MIDPKGWTPLKLGFALACIYENEYMNVPLLPQLSSWLAHWSTGLFRWDMHVVLYFLHGTHLAFISCLHFRWKMAACRQRSVPNRFWHLWLHLGRRSLRPNLSVQQRKIEASIRFVGSRVLGCFRRIRNQPKSKNIHPSWGDQKETSRQVMEESRRKFEPNWFRSVWYCLRCTSQILHLLSNRYQQAVSTW